jgi:drug/metabolite transporter (DMT)-like permease
VVGPSARHSFTLNEAERRVDTGTAAMLINTGPILIAIMAGVFLKDGFPRWLFAGCGVALAGVVLIGLASSQGGSRNGIGIALLLLAASASPTSGSPQQQPASRPGRSPCGA